jgi:APA family basic amino acid/polyamine antiporter
VVALTAVNYQGVQKTAWLTRIIVAVVVAALATVVVGALAGGQASVDNLGNLTAVGGWSGILQSAGLLFFAFAGYARLATLGEEVVDPAKTIPRAIPLALGITLVIYATVAVSSLLAVGPAVLAAAPAPLDAVVRSGSLDVLAPIVRVGGTIAALGVLLSLIVGVSRTAFAMAANGELPRWLDAVHPRHRVPHHAELAVGVVVAVVVLVADLRRAIGFSSFAVLTYYAIANSSARTLPAEHRRWPRSIAIVGLVGCVVLAFTLPAASIVGGATVLMIGSLIWWARRRLSR